MPGQMISLRLDEETERALEVLTRGGRSRSQAVREALLAEARRRTDDLAPALVLGLT